MSDYATEQQERAALEADEGFSRADLRWIDGEPMRSEIDHEEHS